MCRITVTEMAEISNVIMVSSVVVAGEALISRMCMSRGRTSPPLELVKEMTVGNRQQL
jgi:hypothetical protein